MILNRIFDRQLWIVVNPPKSVRWIWLGIALAVGFFYALAALPKISSAYLIPDDGRQHLFWMVQFLDPELFPNDSISHYFQSVSPWAFQSIYRVGAWFNIAPWDLEKWLPIPLSIATAGAGFLLSETWLSLPAANALTGILLLQNLWLRDDLASGTARAFLNPLFLLILLGIQRRSPQILIPSVIVLGGFYPHYVLVTGVILGLGLLDKIIIEKDRDIDIFRLEIIGVIVCILVLLPFAINASEFGPTISRGIAEQLPEFLPNGRSRFFYDDFGRFWLSGGRSGLQIPLDPPLYCFGLLLPILYRWKPKLPLLQQVNPNLKLLTRLTLASLITFFAAHIFLFRLHLPSRYTQHSLRIVLASAAGIALFALLEFAWNRVGNHWGKLIAIALLTFTLLYPLTYKNFPKTNYVIGDQPDLYAYLQTQPKTIRIASLSGAANNIPTFAQRTILTGAEYAIPYHWGYYEPFRQRTLDLIIAQYAPDPTTVAEVIQKYGVTHWLIDRNAYMPGYLGDQKWLKQYDPAYSAVREDLEKRSPNPTPSQNSHIASRLNTCKVFENSALYLLDARCLSKNS
ncbi:MAG: hypothetical protein ACFCA4_08295 [Cyanophyceae cyanobacterium]